MSSLERNVWPNNHGSENGRDPYAATARHLISHTVMFRAIRVERAVLCASGSAIIIVWQLLMHRTQLSLRSSVEQWINPCFSKSHIINIMHVDPSFNLPFRAAQQKGPAKDTVAYHHSDLKSASCPSRTRAVLFWTAGAKFGLIIPLLFSCISSIESVLLPDLEDLVSVGPFWDQL